MLPISFANFVQIRQFCCGMNIGVSVQQMVVCVRLQTCTAVMAHTVLWNCAHVLLSMLAWVCAHRSGGSWLLTCVCIWGFCVCARGLVCRSEYVHFCQHAHGSCIVQWTVACVYAWVLQHLNVWECSFAWGWCVYAGVQVCTATAAHAVPWNAVICMCMQLDAT